MGYPPVKILGDPSPIFADDSLDIGLSDKFMVERYGISAVILKPCEGAAHRICHYDNTFVIRYVKVNTFNNATALKWEPELKPTAVTRCSPEHDQILADVGCRMRTRGSCSGNKKNRIVSMAAANA